MRLKGLIEPLITSDKFSSIKSDIEEKDNLVEISGLSESSKAYFVNSVYESFDKPVVIITHNDMEAKNLYEDLNLYTSNVSYFPAKEVVFYNVDAISGDLRWARLRVIKEILERKKGIIVTSIDAFASAYTPKKLFKDHKLSLKVGKEVSFEEISKVLIEGGYERVEIVEGKGEFSLRGGLLDVFPPDSIYPYRIELFGDEIESIRTFNVESQRSIDKVKTLKIFPAKEMIVNENVIEEALNFMKSELDEVVKNSSDKERIEKLKTIVNRNMEVFRETKTFETIDSYLPFLYKNSETLFDYLDKYMIILDNRVRTLGKLDSTYTEFNENYSIFLERGDILPYQSNLLIPKEKLITLLEERYSFGRNS